MATSKTARKKPGTAKKRTTGKKRPLLSPKKSAMLQALLTANAPAGNKILATNAGTSNIAAVQAAPIVSYGAIFNPDTNIGGIRLVFNGGAHRDFNQLKADVFAAAISILALGQASYNGQYISVAH